MTSDMTSHTSQEARTTCTGAARRVLAMLVRLLGFVCALGAANGAAAQTRWVDLAGGAPGLTNDGQTRSLTWVWAPGGASIRGTVDITRTGAGVHFVLAENQLDTTRAFEPGAGEYDSSPYAVSLGGAAGIRHFGSEGEIGRGPGDVPPGQFSTTVIDFRFDGSVTSPNNTILTLFDPGATEPDVDGVRVFGPASYRFTAFYRGDPVDTSSWTVRVVDPYLPAVNPGHWTWDAASGTYRLERYPSASVAEDFSDYNFPDTLAFIDTDNTTFDRLVVTAEGLAFDTMAIGIGSANVPNLPITLEAGWVNAQPADAVTLVLADAGAENPRAGTGEAPASSTPAVASGLPGQQVTVRQTFTRGDAAHYDTTWTCSRLDNNTVIASGSGSAGDFLMPNSVGVACSFTNTGRASLRLEKALPFGRRNAADQFTLAIDGPGAPAAVTTTGTGRTASGAVAVATATVGAAYTFTEAGAGGASLGDYGSNWACTNTRADGQQPVGGGASFAVTPQAGDELTCTFRNSVRPAADLQVRKTANPAGTRAGEVVSYTIVADNLGPDPADGAVLRDVPGTGLDCGRPSGVAVCTGSGGAACAVPSLPAATLFGTGVAITAFPVGGQVTVTLQCTVTATGVP